MQGKAMTPQDVAMDQHRDAASVTNTGTDMTNAQMRQTHKTLKHAETTIEIVQINKTETEIVYKMIKNDPKSNGNEAQIM